MSIKKAKISDFNSYAVTVRNFFEMAKKTGSVLKKLRIQYEIKKPGLNLVSVSENIYYTNAWWEHDVAKTETLLL